ncbi:MAG: MFS transporter [Deltaproteobacteria bacterium]|nr:MFS transporter [Deltaproteobacteria bacterium]
MVEDPRIMLAVAWRPPHAPDPFGALICSMFGLRLFYFLFFVALGIYSPSFPRWLAAQGIEGARLGVVAAMGPVMGLVSPTLFGWVADRTGLRRGVVATVTWLAAAMMALLAHLASKGSSTFLITLACVAAYAFFLAPMGALADTIALESGVPYGPVRLWGSVGFLVAAIASSRFVDPTSARLPLTVAVALASAGMACAWLPSDGGTQVATEEPVPSEAPRSMLGGRLRALLACTLLLEASHSAYNLCFSLHLFDHGVAMATVGALWALGVLAEIGFFVAGERLLSRFGAGLLLTFGSATLVVRMVVLGAIHDVPAFAASQLLHACTFGATWTAIMRIVREAAVPSTLGRLRGLVSASAAVGGAFGMVAWGASYRAIGGATTFRLAGAVAVLATLLALRFVGEPSRAAPVDEPRSLG